MNFKDAIYKKKLINMIIEKTMKFEGVQYQEDIQDRIVRDLMYVEGLLNNATQGCNSDELQEYYYNQAIEILKDIDIH